VPLSSSWSGGTWAGGHCGSGLPLLVPVQIWVPVSALPTLFTERGLACFDPSTAAESRIVHSHWLQPGEKEASLADGLPGAGAGAAEEDGVWVWV
jgi:hypothetical protein